MQEKHWLVASRRPPTQDQALNPGMCPDQDLNLRPVCLQDDTQFTEPHQSGWSNILMELIIHLLYSKTIFFVILSIVFIL